MDLCTWGQVRRGRTPKYNFVMVHVVLSERPLLELSLLCYVAYVEISLIYLLVCLLSVRLRCLRLLAFARVGMSRQYEDAEICCSCR
jgi:hypothetical protein